LPDIYYIVLDSYTRQDALKEFWDYDNSEFIDYLTSKGFYVASKSRSNYFGTILSLPSSLNMQYINYLSDRVSPRDVTVLGKMIANSEVSRFLKSKGYRYILVSDEGIGGGDMDKYAEVLQYKGVFGIKISSFARSLIKTTALQPFAFYFGVYSTKEKEILYVFDTVADIPSIKEPTFVLAHVCSPHPPFIFDRNGNLVKPSIFRKQDPEERALQEHPAYLEQLIFITKKVETLIDELLSKSDVPPVIILQSDTGPDRYMRQPGSELTEETFMKEKMKILNAYLLPDNGKQLLYESVTPVNSFRIVFNLYFDTDYELLKDESYYGWLGLGTIVPPEGNAD